MNKKITFISDTHNKHKSLNGLLPGGDILVHCGDISSVGYEHEIRNFCSWFNKLDNYNLKIFIAGNHDKGFEDNPTKIKEIVDQYKNIIYLQDDLYCVGEDYEKMIKIWGAPWQPKFLNWAFNAERGEDIKFHWDMIPINTDILITHGAPFGILDTGESYDRLGCEELLIKVKEIKPKIHVFGHLHGGYGYRFDGYTHYFNASVLNEDYEYANKPITIDWDPDTNIIEFID